MFFRLFFKGSANIALDLVPKTLDLHSVTKLKIGIDKGINIDIVMGMAKIKLNKEEKLTIKFVHWKTHKHSVYWAAYNKLTNEWMESHDDGKGSTAYIVTKTDAERLANAIISTSKKHNLKCTVTFKKLF